MEECFTQNENSSNLTKWLKGGGISEAEVRGDYYTVSNELLSSDLNIRG